MAEQKPPSSRPVGRSTTSTKSPGREVALDNPVDNGYLCQKVCACSRRTAIISKSGAHLKQRCATARIWADEEANQLVWRYKAEVGFNMATNPPSPLMSKDQPNRPSRFPLGRATGDGLLKRSLEGKPQKGLLRIPDCIILKSTGPELAAMRASKAINWKRLMPIQANIETVLEMKFGKDELSPEQQRAYWRIAGRDKLRLLEEGDCQCKDDDEDNRGEPATVPERSPVTTPFLPPLDSGRRPPLIGPAPAPVPAPRPVRPSYGPVAPATEGVPLSDYLKSGAKVVGGVVLVAGAVALVYFTAGAGAPLGGQGVAAGVALIVTGVAVGSATNTSSRKDTDT
jgi:hypothetical protein